jgi:hypothetical protein
VKRFIHVPVSLLLENNEIPLKAIELAKKTMLSIQVGEDNKYTDICIVSVPYKKVVEIPPTVESGYVFCIDLTDEFVFFGRDARLIATSETGETVITKPSVRQVHSLRFRSRYVSLGNWKYKITVSETEDYCSGEFRVI